MAFDTSRHRQMQASYLPNMCLQAVGVKYTRQARRDLLIAHGLLFCILRAGALAIQLVHAYIILLIEEEPPITPPRG